mgnify:CR=1 FL=1
MLTLINDPLLYKAGKGRNAKRLTAKVDKAVKESAMPRISHKIILHSRQLQLDPPLQEARTEQHRSFNSLLATILDLERLQASRYDQAIDLGNTGGNASNAVSGAQVILDRRRNTYASLLQQMPVNALRTALHEVEVQLTRVSAYVDQWLQYQALWDMDPNAMFGRLTDDVEE